MPSSKLLRLSRAVPASLCALWVLSYAASSPAGEDDAVRLRCPSEPSWARGVLLDLYRRLHPCNPCDDGNPCTTDSERRGRCRHQPVDGARCDDGNACTRADVCEAGQCVGQARQCASRGECVAGSCDPRTGSCEYSTLPDGSACDDANACNSGDICQGGVCAGTSTEATRVLGTSGVPMITRPAPGGGVFVAVNVSNGDFVLNQFVSADGEGDVIVSKIDAAGNALVSTRIAGAGRQEVIGAALDAQTGDLHVLVNTDTSMTLPIGSQPCQLSASDGLRLLCDDPVCVFDREGAEEGADPVLCTCGNGELDPFEVCDDGNDDELDGCTSSCTFSGPGTPSPDIIIDPAAPPGPATPIGTAPPVGSASSSSSASASLLAAGVAQSTPPICSVAGTDSLGTIDVILNAGNLSVQRVIVYPNLGTGGFWAPLLQVADASQYTIFGQTKARTAPVLDNPSTGLANPAGSSTTDTDLIIGVYDVGALNTEDPASNCRRLGRDTLPKPVSPGSALRLRQRFGSDSANEVVTAGTNQGGSVVLGQASMTASVAQTFSVTGIGPTPPVVVAPPSDCLTDQFAQATFQMNLADLSVTSPVGVVCVAKTTTNAVRSVSPVGLPALEAPLVGLPVIGSGLESPQIEPPFVGLDLPTLGELPPVLPLLPSGPSLSLATPGRLWWANSLAGSPLSFALTTSPNDPPKEFTLPTDDDGTTAYLLMVDTDAQIAAEPRLFGGPGNQVIKALLADAANNPVIAGEFTKEIDLGQGPIAALGARDLFVARYSPSGELLSGRTLGGAGDETLSSLEIDATSGALRLSGTTDLAFSLDGQDVFGNAFLLEIADAQARACETDNPCVVGQCDPALGCVSSELKDGTACVERGIAGRCASGVCCFDGACRF